MPLRSKALTVLILSILATTLIGIFNQTLCQTGTHIVVLCYHHVDLKQRSLYSTSSSQLLQHIHGLKQAGYTFISLKELEKALYDNGHIPSRSALITFDDGNITVYTKVYPQLKELHIPFAVFVYPSGISTGHKKGFMSWSEVKELVYTLRLTTIS